MVIFFSIVSTASLLLVTPAESFLFRAASTSFRSHTRSKIIMSTEETPKVNVRDSLAELSKSGKFERRDSTYRQIVSDDHPIFKPEKGRYHLYVCNGMKFQLKNILYLH